MLRVVISHGGEDVATGHRLELTRPATLEIVLPGRHVGDVARDLPAGLRKRWLNHDRAVALRGAKAMRLHQQRPPTILFAIPLSASAARSTER